MGRRYDLTRDDGGIIAERVGDGIHIALESEQGWDFYFSPPSGWPLVPGDYPGAAQWLHGPGRLPGIMVGGEGRGCSLATGGFTVLEAEYGAEGEVVRFALDFEHRCPYKTGALYGFLRYRSSVPVVPRLAVEPVSRFEGDDGSRIVTFEISLSAPAETVVTVGYRTIDGTATAGSDYEAVSGMATFPVGDRRATVPVKVFGDGAPEDDETFDLLLNNSAGAPIHVSQGIGTILDDDGDLPRTYLYFDSGSGEFLAGGRRFTLTPEDGAIVAEPFKRGVRVSFAGEGLWDLRFEPPTGQVLAVGPYEATGIFVNPEMSRLDIAGNGRWCYDVKGRFEVLELVYGAGGEVVRFAADYVQHCERGPTVLRGSVRFRSRLPHARRAWAGDMTVEGRAESTPRSGGSTEPSHEGTSPNLLPSIPGGRPAEPPFTPNR